jgi:hypothetical protein
VRRVIMTRTINQHGCTPNDLAYMHAPETEDSISARLRASGRQGAQLACAHQAGRARSSLARIRQAGRAARVLHAQLARAHQAGRARSSLAHIRQAGAQLACEHQAAARKATKNFFTQVSCTPSVRRYPLAWQATMKRSRKPGSCGCCGGRQNPNQQVAAERSRF